MKKRVKYEYLRILLEIGVIDGIGINHVGGVETFFLNSRASNTEQALSSSSL